MEAASVYPGVHFVPIAFKREDSEIQILEETQFFVSVIISIL